LLLEAVVAVVHYQLMQVVEEELVDTSQTLLIP
jgi:hypothetical protein